VTFSTRLIFASIAAASVAGVEKTPCVMAREESIERPAKSEDAGLGLEILVE
jgi:hypothetical protein